MADKEHVNCLINGGVIAWNKWRDENPDIVPDLTSADLGDIDVARVNLHNANLSEANLTRVQNLRLAQLGGANLSHAILPRRSPKWEYFPTIADGIKFSQRLFLILISGCLYTLLTIATTSDSALITDSLSTSLPILGTNIRIAAFYLFGPLILACIYFYLNVQLQRLWDRISNLPAIFPDNQSIDKIIPPWLPIGLLYKHLVHLKAASPPLAIPQRLISIVVIWAFFPLFVLPFVFFKYFPQHYWPMTAFHISLIALTTGFGVYSFWVARHTLIHKKTLCPLPILRTEETIVSLPFRGKRTTVAAVPYFRIKHTVVKPGIIAILAACFVGSGFSALFYGGFQAVRQHYTIRVTTDERPLDASNENLPDEFPKFSPLRIGTVPKIFAWFGFSPFPNLVSAEISTKPANWTDENTELVREADLSRRYLRYADAARAFLVKAELQGTDLQRANLVEADLRSSKLVAAKLIGAYLMDSKLQSATLLGADLRGAFLMQADLRNADLFGADAEQARFYGAKLQNANLRNAILQCADFESTVIRWAELYDYRWDTSKGNTVTVVFADAANFQDADLRGARLEGARLKDVPGLTQEQIDKACVNEQTRLPSNLTKPEPCKTQAERFVPQAERKTAYSTFAIGSLQHTALQVAKAFREFIARVDREHGDIDKTSSEPPPKSSGKKGEVRGRDAEESSRLIQNQIAEYNRRFRPAMIQLRMEILSRLPAKQSKSDSPMPILYSNPTNPLGMTQVADDLESLAQRLCGPG